MFSRGFSLLWDGDKNLTPLIKGARKVGIKINTLGGRSLSTRPEVALSLAKRIRDSGIPESDLLIWDRTCRELKDAGYRLSRNSGDIRIFGTDTPGVGYESDLVAHLSIGSRFSRIITSLTDVSVSLALLKDHGLAGITAGMKNYFGAIHNPNKYHDDGCCPFVAEVFDAPPVRRRHRLTVLDALTVQFHRGPSFHRRWAAPYGALIFSTDAVAADTVGQTIIERLRAETGLPSLKEEGREPRYLVEAARMGLGRAALQEIQVIEEEA
jgi:uncharacterized protein (DUF362 family)